MTDYFAGGLVAGLVILAAALLVSNTSWSGVGYATSGGLFSGFSGSQPELVLADLGSVRSTGAAITDTVSEMQLGHFDITGIVSEQSVTGGVVQSGVLFGDRPLKYSVVNPEFIRFTVTRTNDYGTLTVRVNGKDLQTWKSGIGEQTIPLNVRGPADIELVASNSGWKIWAPTLYELTNVAIGSVNPMVGYNFAKGEDFVRGEFMLSAENGQGFLDVNLNGEQLWSGALSSGSWNVIPFWRVNDVNTISVDAFPGSKFTGNAKLVLYHEHSDARPYEASFNLTNDQLGKLPGYVRFEIVDVQRPGTIVVKLKSGNQTKLSESVEAKVGVQAVAFYKQNIVAGSVTHLVIESSDALFSLRNVRVTV